MDSKKEVKKYFNKYFKEQYYNENDDEFKSLVKLLNKAQKAAKNCSTPTVSDSFCSCEMPAKVKGKNECWRCKKPFKDFCN